MPRPKQLTPSVFKNIAIPEPLAQKLEIELYSEFEERIPNGAYKLFFTNLLEQYFAAAKSPCKHCSGTGVKA